MVEIINLATKSCAVCPACSAWIPLRAKKKDKSYSLIEYKKHYTREHGSNVPM
jgi:hypothetical protein